MKYTRDTFFLRCTDYLISKEEFDLYHNKAYDLLITHPQPPAEKLGNYYKSDAYISHTDAKKSWFDVLYQVVKKYMLNKKIGYLHKYHPRQGRLLDIGAGTGDFLLAAKNKNWQVAGIEPSAEARNLASKKEIELLPEESQLAAQKFDVISMWHVLEHVPQLEKQIALLENLLEKNGTLFIAVPNFKSYDAQVYKNNWAAFDVPRHLWHFSKSAIEKLFAPHGFTVKEIIPLPFDAYYVSLLSEKHQKNTSYLRALKTGFLSNWKGRRTKEYSSHLYVLKKA